MKKHFLPESFDFGMPSVELIGVGTKGLDKTAMVKRASAFDDVIGDLKKKPNREYLHVITTGAFEKYGANANCFIGETPVLTTLTGKRKKIKDIKEGDLVLTGKGRLRPVTKVYVRKYAGEIIEVWGTEWKSKVSMTAEHPVQVVNPGNRETLGGKFVKACTLTINDELVVPAMDHVKSGNKEFHDKVALVRSRNAKCSTVFNLEVEEDHTYCIPFVVHNCDGWNGESFDLEFPHPEDQKKKKVTLDGGLSKYHDDTYMKNGAVYQEHKTKRAGVDPSGEVVAARYNPIMKRGELIISVDTGKWASRLQKKAQGKDIYLSIGADVPHDTCFPKGTLVLTDKGYIPIEEVEVGAVVHTQQGNWKRVTATCINQTQALTRISTMGFPLPLESTQNHPVYVVKAEQVRSCHGSTKHNGVVLKRRHTLTDASDTCTYCNKEIDLTASYVPASDIKINDYVKVKLDDSNEVDTVGTSFAYLCGQYIGDGSALKERTGHDKNGVMHIAGISISASASSADADIIQRIQQTFYRCTGKTASVRPEKDKNAYVVTLHDSLLACRILTLCGQYSDTKFLSKELMQWSVAEKMAFLAGYVDSDGSIDATNKQGIRIATVNRGLALSVLRLCWSIGIRATCCLGNTTEYRKQGKWGGPSCGPSYCVGFREWPTDLMGYSAKVSRYPELKSTVSGATVMLHKGFAYIRVTGTSTFICDEVLVYNFEVADDNTYNAEGIDVHNCNICGRIAKTASQHCDHFKKHRGQVYDSGVRACVMNDSPSFYDISGVDVPADQIAFVLSKVASGVTAKEAALEVLSVCTPRRPMLYTKAAAILDKLSKMEKQLVGMVEGDKQEPAFHDDDEVAKDFILKVENFPSDEIIDSCNRKGILLSPGMLFKIMGKDCTEETDKEMLCGLEDDCCGDCSTMFEDMEEDECCNEELLDGSFDEHLPADLSLDDILEKFVPEFGVTQPAMQGKIITVTITGRKGKEPKQESKEASLNKQAQEALRRTYARYVISFAERNDDATCYNALRKIAVYGK